MFNCARSEEVRPLSASLPVRRVLCVRRGTILLNGKRKPIPTVDGLGFQAALTATASLQFQGRSSLSLEAKCPRAS